VRYVHKEEVLKGKLFIIKMSQTVVLQPAFSEALSRFYQSVLTFQDYFCSSLAGFCARQRECSVVILHKRVLTQHKGRPGAALRVRLAALLALLPTWM
jgi:hypothetical protein